MHQFISVGVNCYEASNAEASCIISRDKWQLWDYC